MISLRLRPCRPSLVVVPAGPPASTSAWETQFRNVSGLIPNCSRTRRRASVRVAESRRRSTAILTARCRSSSGYFLGAAMTLILPWNETFHQTRHGTPEQTASDLASATRLEDSARLKDPVDSELISRVLVDRFTRIVLHHQRCHHEVVTAVPALT